jgi:hypothetical protein
MDVNKKMYSAGFVWRICYCYLAGITVAYTEMLSTMKQYACVIMCQIIAGKLPKNRVARHIDDEIWIILAAPSLNLKGGVYIPGCRECGHYKMFNLIFFYHTTSTTCTRQFFLYAWMDFCRLLVYNMMCTCNFYEEFLKFLKLSTHASMYILFLSKKMCIFLSLT